MQHLSARAMQPRLQRAERKSQPCGKLTLWYLRKVMLFYQRPTLAREAAQRAIQQKNAVAPRQLLGRIEALRIGEVGKGIDARLIALPLHLARPQHALLPQVATADVAADTVQPRGKSRLVAQVLQRAPSLQQRLLNDILRRVG